MSTLLACHAEHRARAESWMLETRRAMAGGNAEHAAYCIRQAVRQLRYAGEPAAWGVE
jgi:hypothetical protein